MIIGICLVRRIFRRIVGALPKMSFLHFHTLINIHFINQVSCLGYCFRSVQSAQLHVSLLSVIPRGLFYVYTSSQARYKAFLRSLSAVGNISCQACGWFSSFGIQYFGERWNCDIPIQPRFCVTSLIGVLIYAFLGLHFQLEVMFEAVQTHVSKFDTFL